MPTQSQTIKFFLVLLLLLVATCTTTKQSSPPRTATEELLISTAADRAAAKLALQIPKNAKVFVDASNFDGTDSKYAIGAIRGSLLQHGLVLADDKKTADVIIEIRAGALSIDQKQMLIGIPSFTVPVPFASTGLTTPTIAFYETDTQKGVAKFAANAYNDKGFALSKPTADMEYGLSHDTKHILLIFFSWENNDAVPQDDDITNQGLSPTNTSSTPPASQ